MSGLRNCKEFDLFYTLQYTMVTVHHLNNSRSQRVLWLLGELGVPYEAKRYERDPKTLLEPPALLAVHPLGKSPVITDNGATMAESGAIIEYLVDAYGAGRLIPAMGTPKRRRYTYWLHYVEGSAMPSAADIQMSFPPEAARSRAGLAAGRPKLVDFLSRIHGRSAYQRALERGGPYSF
jgi:glutathione S-transferase